MSLLRAGGERQVLPFARRAAARPGASSRSAADRQRRRRRPLGGARSRATTGSTGAGRCRVHAVVRARHRHHPHPDRRPSLPRRRGARRRAVPVPIRRRFDLPVQGEGRRGRSSGRGVLVEQDRAPEIPRRAQPGCGARHEPDHHP
ncbi:MAG: hypothetical protein MZV70_34015 [Desulfobacterales bacterium]|nr:hypothetical protein [Desulfobacterales bacterium]